MKLWTKNKSVKAFLWNMDVIISLIHVLGHNVAAMIGGSPVTSNNAEAQFHMPVIYHISNYTLSCVLITNR